MGAEVSGRHTEPLELLDVDVPELGPLELTEPVPFDAELAELLGAPPAPLLVDVPEAPDDPHATHDEETPNASAAWLRTEATRERVTGMEFPC